VSGYIFDEQLVLVGEDGAKWASGDQTAFAVEGKCWVNNHAHVLRPHRTRLIDNWLIHFFFFSDLSEFVSGLTVPKLNQGNLREIPIPLPPLAEQQRIVGLLDDAFEGLATAKATAQKNLQNARALFESHLQSVFIQRGPGWDETRLESCCEQIFAGGDVPKDRLSHERSAKFSIPIYSNGEKNDGLYGFTDVPRVTKSSITVSARGTLGFTAIRTEPFLPVVRLIVLVPDEKQITLSFLYYAVVGMDFGNTGTSIPQLTVPNFKESMLYVPSISEQEVIVEQLDALSEETQRLARLYERKLAALEALKKSLLHQAFTGEL
jgi:type I restriction enzyme S subunit